MSDLYLRSEEFQDELRKGLGSLFKFSNLIDTSSSGYTFLDIYLDHERILLMPDECEKLMRGYLKKRIFELIENKLRYHVQIFAICPYNGDKIFLAKLF